MFRAAGILAALIVAATAAPAVSQARPATVCDQRETVLDHLRSRYQEEPVALGVANNGGLVEVLSTDNGTTWTIVITLPNGMTCLLAAGQNWENFPEINLGSNT